MLLKRYFKTLIEDGIKRKVNFEGKKKNTQNPYSKHFAIPGLFEDSLHLGTGEAVVKILSWNSAL